MVTARSLLGSAILASVMLLVGCTAAPPKSTLLNRLPSELHGLCRSDMTATATPDPEVARAESVAMPAPQFWSLIGELHASNTDKAYSQLSTQLAALPETQMIGFAARLTLSLYALDDQCRAQWDAKHNPTADGFVADDDFLYDRADTVTAGQVTWSRAVRTDTLPWGSVDIKENDGESLLYVADDAAHKAGIKDSRWQKDLSHAFSLDYDTGSNPAGWPPQTN